MQRHRFFATPENIAPDCITLDGEESRHLSRVLRLTEGESVFVFDGAGTEYECEVANANKHAASLRIISQLKNKIESPLQLTLAQSLVKGDKFDLVIQKATELGATRIVPLITSHSDIKHIEERSDHKLTRWRRIALEAVKQCGRRTLVEITEPEHFDQFCAKADASLKIILAESKGRPLREVASVSSAPDSVIATIGPEGGWHPQELTTAISHNFVPVHLGPRILRTETAAITGVALVQFLFGDSGFCHRDPLSSLFLNGHIA